MSITSLLAKVRNNEISIDEAEEQIRLLRFREISVTARIDDCQSKRTGIPEAILAEGESSDDLVEIVEVSLAGDARILTTRVLNDQLRELRSRINAQFMEWNGRGRTLVCGCGTITPKKQAGGSVSSLPALLTPLLRGRHGWRQR